MFDSVLISSGSEVGGVQSFAEALKAGFDQLGLPSEIKTPKNLAKNIDDLRNVNKLKILSTSACFLAPIARSTICVAHGFPRSDAQGIVVAAGVQISLKIARRTSILVAVSDYVKTHLEACYGINCAGVIKSALNPIFFNSKKTTIGVRKKIIYVGRLHPVKNIESFFPALFELVLNSDCEVHIIGEGPSKFNIAKLIEGRKKIFLRGNMTQAAILTELQNSAVFFSGCTTEALGLTYLEALSQGCSVIMPTSGGGIDIAPNLIGKKIFLYGQNNSVQEGLDVFKAAISSPPTEIDLQEFEPKIVAQKYLDLYRAVNLSK